MAHVSKIIKYTGLSILVVIILYFLSIPLGLFMTVTDDRDIHSVMRKI
jgi:hypothetical protein